MRRVSEQREAGIAMGLTPYQAALIRDAAARALFVLPHEARRHVVARLQPGQHKLYQDMRKHELGVVPGQTVSLASFDRLKCIFVHVPKCAGTSIGQALFGEYEGNHLPIPMYQLIFSEHEFSTYFKFAFTRNPWDRLLSAYRSMKHGAERLSSSTMDREPDRLVAGDRDFEIKFAAHREVQKHDDFEHFVTAWVNRKNARLYEHFRPQHRFVCSMDNRLQLDFVARFESIDNDLAYIAERLEIDASLMHQNRSLKARASYRDMYTPKTRAIIENVYKKDIEMLGYSFDDG